MPQNRFTLDISLSQADTIPSEVILPAFPHPKRSQLHRVPRDHPTLICGLTLDYAINGSKPTVCQVDLRNEIKRRDDNVSTNLKAHPKVKVLQSRLVST